MSRMLSWTLSSGQRAGGGDSEKGCAILGSRVTLLGANRERVLIEGRGSLGT